MRHIELYRIRHILLSGIYVLAPSVLIFLQPDLGQVVILVALWIAILVISGIKIRHFSILCLVLFLILILTWSFLLMDYQKARILSFIMPQLEPLGTGWSQAQAKIAIGSGGIFGKGISQGVQTQYGFLPEPQTDFIFSAIAEEMGLIGTGFLFFLFSVLIWRAIKIAISGQSNFPRLFASGFSILLISQIFIHIGMNLGLLPIIGIPLPLISYGGSSLLVNFVGLAILQSIKTH
jgi:rod shape determining protein RodA